MNVKRIILSLMALLLLCSGVALAETDGFVWNDWTCGVGEYTGMETEVVIPNVVDGHTVDTLGDDLFRDNTFIVSVVIPEGVTTISNGSFNNCTALEQLSLPKSLVAIGASSLQDLTGLKELTIPAGVAYIGSNSLIDCGATDITFEGLPPVMESGVLSWPVGDVTFHVPDDYYDEYYALLQELSWNCTVEPSGRNAVIADRTVAETDFAIDRDGVITAYNGTAAYVRIPSQINGITVTSVAEGAFTFSGRIRPPVYVLELPDTIEMLPPGAFKDCKVPYIILPDNLKEIGSEAFSGYQGGFNWPAGLEIIGDHAFENAWVDSTLKLPTDLRVIGDYAFATCGIYEVWFPASIERIGTHAFDGNESLTYLNFAGHTLPELAEDAFTGIADVLTDVDMPWDTSYDDWAVVRDTFAGIGAVNCTVWRNNPISAGVAAYPEGIFEIKDGEWVLYSGEQPDLTVWSSYESCDVWGIGNAVFKGNQTLRSFWPHHCDTFTTIGSEAFADSSLASIEMYDSITTVKDGAFRNCVNLTEITLPRFLETIAADAFQGCTGITSVTIDCEPSVLPDGLLADCPVETVTLRLPVGVSDSKELVSRLGISGEPVVLTADGREIKLVEMTCAETAAKDFNTENSTLGLYNGYERNLALPREKDGAALTIMGSSVLDRAMDHDYTDTCELPVLSVVVPENYTGFEDGAFGYLVTVETVIIYTPMDEVPEGFFTACSALKNVVFVNGVKAVRKDAFMGCYNLENLYFGPDCVIEDDAWFSEPEFGEPQVLTELPDVDALLADVASDPYVPEVKEDIRIYAEPITDPSAETVLGVWKLDQVIADGEAIAPAELGIQNYTLTLSADGTFTLNNEGEEDVSLWRMENGQVSMLIDTEDDFTPVPVEDGVMTITTGGLTLQFVIETAEKPEMPAVADSRQMENADSAGMPFRSTPEASISIRFRIVIWLSHWI